MANLITTIRAYFARLSHQSARDNAQRIEQAAESEAQRALQIREFQGAIYLSYNNRPILPLSDTEDNSTTTAVEVLHIARRTYRDFLITNERKQSL